MLPGLMLKKNIIRLEGERSTALDLARGRLIMISMVFALLYTVLALRALDLAALQGFYASAEEVLARRGTGHETLAVRGDIYDRTGRLMGTTLKTPSLYADPFLIADPGKTAAALHDLFPGLNEKELAARLRSDKRFVWIKRNIMPHEHSAVLNIGEPGLSFQYENVRVYPQGALAAHMLGYVTVDGQGISALERYFDKTLASGQSLTLSLDIRIQHAVRRALLEAIEVFAAKAGSGVVMDVHTGEILAGVSLPDFNPHMAGRVPDRNIFNRLVMGVYELGSVFKIFSTAALLEAKNIPLSTTFDVRDPIRRGRFTINDYHPENRVLTVPEVFMYSSNIGSAMMGDAVGTQDLKRFYRDLGLLDPLRFEIMEAGRPLVAEPWRDIHTLTASYGHGLATTPLQVTAAVASVVNGGYLVQPTLLKVTGEKENTIRIVSEKTSRYIRDMMRLVVTDGTGKSADVPGYLVGGKTGTAEKPSARGYDRDRLVSSFVGIFPAHAPRYVIFVAVDEPKGHPGSYGYATGGWVAAPAVADIIRSMVAIKGMTPFYGSGVEDPAIGLQHYVSAREES